MSWLMFIDESGQDRRESPYEVLAGVVIEDRILWNVIQQIGSAQEYCFGYRRFSEFEDEAKAKKLLKKKTFRHAESNVAFDPAERRRLAQEILNDGTNVSRHRLAALGQAKLEYVRRVLQICIRNHCVAFASIVHSSTERPAGDSFLRKDYTYLFERYHHFLSHDGNGAMGMIVFDELDKSQSHLLISQMEAYFIRTKNGQERSRLVVPEPLFVHSDLTTMIQIADLVAYIISWGVRLRYMTEDKRGELDEFASLVCQFRYHHVNPTGYDKWGFSYIRNLLPNPTS